jgi:pimeloyl-ACP methyl ester carboxylesterase
MPQFEYGPISIRFEVHGSGFPVLLIAPGAMESAIDMWEGATISPLALYDGAFRLIAMDQRNAGRSFRQYERRVRARAATASRHKVAVAPRVRRAFAGKELIVQSA